MIKNLKGEPTSVDVYCWGITLYSLLANLTKDQLNDDAELRKTDYPAFLNKVKTLKVKGDTDGTLTENAKKILLKVLSLNPKDRPCFNELLNMTESPELNKNKLNEIQKELAKVIKEKGIINIIVDDLNKKYKALSIEYGKICLLK